MEQDEEGVYIASCPAIEGCYTLGDAYKEAIDNLKDAIQLHVEARRELGEPITSSVSR